MKLVRIHPPILVKHGANLGWVASALSLVALGGSLFTRSAGATPDGTSWLNDFDVSKAIIPLAEIRPGGPPRDGIPAIDRPKFIRADQVDFLRADDLVVSFTVKDQTRAYPLRILVWHEIVNDQMGGQAFAVTYCPLCGTAMVFNRQFGRRALVFGVSGLLYQSDVLLYDRQTGSLWSQLAMKAVSGPQVNTALEWLPSEQLTWAAWKRKYPRGEVLSTQTGYRRNYAGAAYMGYAQSPETLFPVTMRRTELPKKEWVLGVVVDGVARAYPVRSLPANRTVRDQVNQATLEITYDPVRQLAVVSRAERGEPIPCVKVYWFAWQAFYPETRLWQP